MEDIRSLSPFGWDENSIYPQYWDEGAAHLFISASDVRLEECEVLQVSQDSSHPRWASNLSECQTSD